MRDILRRLLARHEPVGSRRLHIKAVFGAAIAITLVGALAAVTQLPMLFAALGPTAVLVFSQPQSPLAQPVNVFGGYFIAALVSALAETVFPGLWWAATLAVGCAMAGMLMLRVTHPPAVSLPLVTLVSPMSPPMLFGLILVSCIILVGLGMLHHVLPPRSVYPLRITDGSGG